MALWAVIVTVALIGGGLVLITSAIRGPHPDDRDPDE